MIRVALVAFKGNIYQKQLYTRIVLPKVRKYQSSAVREWGGGRGDFGFGLVCFSIQNWYF
jgi:hypothetical protein